MTSWRRLSAAALAILLTGCATAPSEPRPAKPCPPLAVYSADEQRAALAERDWLAAVKAPAPCTVCTMLDDFLLMRDQCR